MREVAVVTDTTACIPAEQVERYGIKLVAVPLIIRGKTYRDGIDISPSEFYALLRKAKKTPTTSSASPEQYLEAYHRASQKAPGVLCLTEPSRFSAMFNAAQVAQKMAGKSLPDSTVAVIEGTTAAAGLGLVALAAARVAEAGGSMEEVMATARDTMSRVNLFATLDTLSYLARSGRVPQAAALVNSLLSIKPVFTLNHSDAHTVALPRTMESAIKRMLKLLEQHTAPGRPLHAAIMHADAPTQARDFKDRVSTRFACRELFITEFTPVMGVHTGPGLLGLAFYNEP